MGPLGSGPRCGTDGLDQYKTPAGWGSIRAQRGRARSAVFLRVIKIVHHIYWSKQKFWSLEHRPNLQFSVRKPKKIKILKILEFEIEAFFS